MSKLSQCELNDVLIYDIVSGIFSWKKTSLGMSEGAQAGTKTKKGYIRIKIKGRDYLAHRLAWLYVNGEMPSKQIDHINNKRDDNRISNLRCATSNENARNALMRADNTSGVKGVCFDKIRRKWIARVGINGENKHVGYFDSILEADMAIRKFREENHGNFFNHGLLKAP